MVDINKYIEGGKVSKVKIAMDIKYRTLTSHDIDELVSDPRIRESFFGNGYTEKKPKSEWTKDYLEQLSYAVVSEAFNEEYLRYLDKVADTVAGHKQNSSVSNYLVNHPVAVGISAVCVIGTMIALFYFLNK